MSDWRILRNATSGEVILPKVKWCGSFWCRFRGLMGVSKLPDTDGLLFVEGRESKAATTIHMFFMRFSIGVVWLDKHGTVVDKQFAKPWRPAYAPKKAAQYFVEANPSILERVQVGDVLRFDEQAS